jgi:hypothetical protein
MIADATVTPLDWQYRSVPGPNINESFRGHGCPLTGQLWTPQPEIDAIKAVAASYDGCTIANRGIASIGVCSLVGGVRLEETHHGHSSDC